MITQSGLKDILHYDPVTGIFTWIKSKRNGWVGKVAGNLTKCPKHGGYINIRIGGRDYKAHRLAWLYVTGKFPLINIDHINLKRSDNRFFNLRESDQSGNTSNILRPKNNTSGVKGVYWHRVNCKWVAYITKAGKRIYLGSFTDKAAAVNCIRQARSRLHGEFANHG